ncbi:23794_t:CDS:2, partial [Dentiscutata erythropus]
KSFQEVFEKNVFEIYESCELFIETVRTEQQKKAEDLRLTVVELTKRIKDRYWKVEKAGDHRFVIGASIYIVGIVVIGVVVFHFRWYRVIAAVEVVKLHHWIVASSFSPLWIIVSSFAGRVMFSIAVSWRLLLISRV